MFVDSSLYGNKMYDVHFFNLKNFRHCFDCCTFWISLKDFGDENQRFATEIIKTLMSIGYTENTEFKIVKNDDFREATCFYEEVAEKIKNGDNELIFFSHSKGLSNEINESLLQWICAMYYFGLNFIDELSFWFLSGNTMNSCFYGFPFSHIKGCYLTDYNYFYAGTMYWVKTERVRRVLFNNKKNIEGISDRWYAETFPGNHVDSFCCLTHRGCDVMHNGFYHNFCQALKDYFERSKTPSKEVDDFFEYYNEMVKFIDLK